MKLFDLDSPLMQALNKVADLLWLNVLTMICCIPVVTAGASLTALHYMALKMARNEECYITRDFFKSFKANFKQGTIIGVILLFIIVGMTGDYFIIKYSGLEFNNVFQMLFTALAILVFFTSMFLFPVLAKFENTVLRTIRNAFYIGVLQFPKTILMMILTVLPAALFFFVPQIIPLVFLLGLSVPAWLSAKLYSNFFKKLEDQFRATHQPEEEEEQEDLRIFRDELDESLSDHSDL